MYIAHNPEIPDLDRRCSDFVKKVDPNVMDLGAELDTRFMNSIGYIVASVADYVLGANSYLESRGRFVKSSPKLFCATMCHLKNSPNQPQKSLYYMLSKITVLTRDRGAAMMDWREAYLWLGQ